MIRSTIAHCIFCYFGQRVFLFHPSQLIVLPWSLTEWLTDWCLWDLTVMTLAFEDAEFTLMLNWIVGFVKVGTWICQFCYLVSGGLKKVKFFCYEPSLNWHWPSDQVGGGTDWHFIGNQRKPTWTWNYTAGRQRSQFEQEVADESALLPPIKTKCPIVIENSGFFEIPSLHL